MVQKLQFRDAFQKNAANYFQKDFGHLNPYQLSKALGFSYISEILDFQNPDIFPTEWDQLEDYITDGANDNGTDMIYSQDSTHHIFQFKYRKKNDIENYHEVETFKDIIWKRLHPRNTFTKNSQLEEAVSRINFKDDVFNLYYITLGRKNDIISKISDTPIENIDDNYLKDLSDRCFFNFIDEDTLNESMRVKNNRPEMGIDVDISFSKNGDRSWLKYESEGRKSYIGTLSTSQIKKIWSDKNNKDNLFNLNIRMHLGDNATNKNIKNTALEDHDNFFFYNNGISAVAQKIVEKDSNQLNCKNFSIINGAQTFKSLALVHDKGMQSKGNSYKDLEIMIRLTEISDLMKNSNSENFIDKVTRYNNTQNVVK
ncbi:MAG: AIPR family protein, partial [Paracoccaceae bacterium]